MRRLLVAAALAAAAVPAAPATAACARTPGSVYWEACVREHGCRVYLWASMPPALCV